MMSGKKADTMKQLRAELVERFMEEGFMDKEEASHDADYYLGTVKRAAFEKAARVCGDVEVAKKIRGLAKRPLDEAP
jgi:hypothetical protein